MEELERNGSLGLERVIVGNDSWTPSGGWERRAEHEIGDDGLCMSCGCCTDPECCPGEAGAECE